MNSSSKLHFIEWQKPAQEFTFVGWRPREGLLFAREPSGDPKVLQLDLPTFHQHVGQQAPSLSRQPGQTRLGLPEAVPVTIKEIRLMPPPCRGKLSEAELLRQQARGEGSAHPHFLHHSQARAWELARLRYDTEVLVPTPADDGEFAKALEAFLADRRKEYDERKAELATLTLLVNRRLGVVGHARFYSYLSSWPNYSLGWRLDQERQCLESGFPQGCLQWTAADAHGRPSIRNPILRARWFQICGLSPTEMQTQRQKFLATVPPLEPRTGFFARAGRQPDLLRRVLGYPSRYSPLDDLEEALGVFGDATWEQLAFCAQVRFLITFEDQTQVWLADCFRRAPQNQGERAEFVHEPRPAASGELSIPVALMEPAAQLKTVVQELKAETETLTKAGQQARADAESGAAKLAAAGDHVETKSQAAAQTLRRAQKELQPTLDDLETNAARLEAMVDEFKLKENPRQTRRALINHGVPERIGRYVMEHLVAGKPVPKAPTAARELQKKYATQDGINRKTVDRQFRKALPLLRAAGWPEHLLPASSAAGVSETAEAGAVAGDPEYPETPAKVEVVPENEASDPLTPFERIQQAEQGSADQP